MSGAPERVRVALLGCGAWGSNILRVLAESRRADVRAVADPLPQSRMRAAALAPGALLVDSLDEALATGVDAVLVATPAHTHAALVLAALDAGVDVFVEKPLALGMLDAERCAARAAASGRIGMVGHLLRYHPAVVRLLDLCASGALGELLRFEAARLSVGGDRSAHCLWTLGPHDLSVLHALDPSPIAGLTASSPPGGDLCRVSLDLTSGLGASIELSRAHPSKERKITVIGTRGAAVFDDVRAPDRVLLGAVRGTHGESAFEPGAASPVPWAEPLALEIAHFFDCITTRRAPLTSFDTAVPIVRALCRAEEAASAPLGHARLVEGEARLTGSG
ncbi:MAG: Gfo/Idh/MocA family oxidoreductase [Byssovorax sp.]